MKRIIFSFLFCFLFVFGVGVVHSKDVTLSWDASPSENVKGYVVYWGYQDKAGENPELFPLGAREDAGNVLTYTVKGVPEQYDIYFAVTAYNASQQSNYSNTVMQAGIPFGQTIHNIELPVREDGKPKAPAAVINIYNAPKPK